MMNIDELIDEVARTKACIGRLPRDQLAGQLTDALADFTGTSENQRFAERVSPTGNYMRLLLTSPSDDIQIILVFWGPGQGSPIHDHDGTIGAVSALTGQTREIKYQIAGRDELGVTLVEESNFLIVPTKITQILPEDDMQLHLMVNETQLWAATVHIYLTAIHRYRVYERKRDDLYHPVETELWFDRTDVWREMPKGGSTDFRPR
jgi:predicted metal-dependent enzyme (double-stranded beta helix superfamily)